MATSIQRALSRLTETHGSVDRFVQEALRYESEEALHEAFSAEQVDGIALALDNLQKGSGMIIGDQTGIGKGRVVAAMIRYAVMNGKVPVFVTEKQALYADMYRDLTDIGFGPEIVEDIMQTNSDAVDFDAENGVVLKSPGGWSKTLGNTQGMPTDRKTLKEKKIVFTTYDQLNTQFESGGSRKKKGGNDLQFSSSSAADQWAKNILGVQQQGGGQMAPRRRFIDQLMRNRNVVLIMDESHNAGGSGDLENLRPDPKTGVIPHPRALFFRQIIPLADGVIYSSATYAKNPDVMDLYSATDLKLGVGGDINALAETVTQGGIPFQQITAAMLSESGQYIRRERSFDGVTYTPKVYDVDTQAAELVSAAMSDIRTFEETFISPAFEADGEATGSNAVGSAGEQSQNFTSLMHNVISQMLLALKVRPAVKDAIKILESGRGQNEQVILTVSNTMGSFITQYAEDMKLVEGDEVQLRFNDLLQRYLYKTREYTTDEEDEKGNKVRFWLSDEELGAAGVAAYGRVSDMIDSMSLDSLPVSPVDFMLNELNKAGFPALEITGRDLTIDYSGRIPVLSRRDPKERSVNGRNTTIRRFNSGQNRAIILNRSGSTGISLHASEKNPVKGQGKRTMIVVQAEQDINVHMQMLGRPHRTGQVVVPAFIQAVANVPAEKKQAAVLVQKMAGLNANTTADADSLLTDKGTVNFMNKYGNIICARTMRQNPQLNTRLGSPYTAGENGKEGNLENLAKKVTGRLPLLSIKEQEQVYQAIEEAYVDFIAELDAMGRNDLEAKTYDLDAKTLGKKEVIAKKGDSPFEGAAYAETVDMKRIGKPFTTEEVLKLVDEHKGEGEKEAAEALAAFEAYRASALQEYVRKVDEALTEPERDATRAIMDQTATKLQDELNRFQRLNDYLTVGKPLSVNLNMGVEEAEELTGIVIGKVKRGNPKNPLAPGSWRVRIAVADGIRIINLPFTRISLSAADGTNSVILTRTMGDTKVAANAFDAALTKSREERVIITGNLFSGFSTFRDAKGQIVNFTREDGSIEQGVLMPRKFNPQESLDKVPVAFETFEQVTSFFDKTDGYINLRGTGNLRIVHTKGNYVISCDKSTSRGARYFRDDKQLLDIVGMFFSRSGRMVTNALSEAEVGQIFDLFRSRGNTWIADKMLKEAREATGRERANHADGEKTTSDPAEDIRYSRNEGNSRAVNLEVIGEATDERSREDIRRLYGAIVGADTEGNGGRGTGGGHQGLDPVRVQPELEQAARKIAGIFGKRVVYFRDENGIVGANGVVLKRTNSNVVYINVNNDHLPLSILGHELVHTLQNDHPDLYQSLRSVLTSRSVLNGSALFDYIAEYRAKHGAAGETDEVITEEMIGDFVGDNFADPAFWQALGERNPSIFAKIIKAVADFLDAVISRITGEVPSLKTHAFYKNIEAARGAVRWAMAKYAERQQQAGEASEQQDGGDVYYSRKEAADSPVSLESLEEIAQQMGSITYIKNKKPDSTFLDRIISTPEYYFKKFGAAGRVLQAALARRDIRFVKEKEILNGSDKDGAKATGFVEFVRDLRKDNKEAYTEANEYLLTADREATGFRIKPSSDEERWQVKAPKWARKDGEDEVIGTFEEEAEAVKAMIEAEGKAMIEHGYSAAAVEAVKMARELTNRGFDTMAADMRKIIAEARENGLPDPFVGDGQIDEAGRYAVYAAGKKMPIALFASEAEAEAMLKHAAEMISYVVLGTKKGGERSFKTELKAKQWAARHSGTVKGQPMFQNLVVKKRTDAEMRPLTVKQALAQIGDLRGIYFPRIREAGEYVLIAERAGANSIRKHFDVPTVGDDHPKLQKVLGMVTPIGREARRLKAMGYTITIKKDNSPSEDVFEATNLVSSLDAILQDSMKVIDKNSDTQVRSGQHINQILTMQIADIFKSRGYLSSRIRRLEGDAVWEGYEEDMGKALIQYGKNVAAGTAKRDTARAMILAFSGRDYSWAEYKAEVEDPDWTEYQEIVEKRRIDPRTQKNLFRDVRTFMVDVLRNDEQADRIMGVMKGLAVLKYLGFRVSSAAVNITNMVQGVPATIAGHTGEPLHKAFGRVTAAAVAYGKYRSGKGDLSEEDKAIFRHISENGWDEAQFNYEAARELRSKLGESWNKFMVASMFMFGAAEKANRAMTIFAAYKAVREKEATAEEHVVWEKAKEISDRAHGIYGKETIPAWARGKLNPLRLTYTFQKFGHNYMLNMLDLGFNKKEYKAAAYMLLSPALLAGSGASLAGPALFALAGALGIGGDDPEEEWYKQMEKTFGAGEFARHGLFGVAGINIKGSLAMNLPMPADIGNAKLTDLAGPAGGVLTDTAKGLAHLLKGDVAKGAEFLLPTAFGSMSKATREATEGITTSNYGTVFYGDEPLKADAVDAFLRFVSFNPARLSGIREKQWNEKEVAARYQEEKSEIYAKIKRLHIQGKRITPEILKTIKVYNDRISESDRGDLTMITPKTIKTMLHRNDTASKVERMRAVR